MKLEVGMYVRFVTGFEIKINKPIVRIGKIEDINNYCITINVFSRQIILSLKEFDELKRKEPSHNIIDLIEVGDYVNGLIVEKSKYGELYTSYTYIGGDIGLQKETYTTFLKDYEEDYIYSIVTKEQFESMSYHI